MLIPVQCAVPVPVAVQCAVPVPEAVQCAVPVPVSVQSSCPPQAAGQSSGWPAAGQPLGEEQLSGHQACAGYPPPGQYTGYSDLKS